MSWYYNVKAAQQAKEQAAAQTPQPQTPTATPVNATGSPNQPLGPDPQGNTASNIVKQIPATATTPAQTYVRTDYQISSKQTVTNPNGEQLTTITLEPIKNNNNSPSQVLSNNLFSGNRNSLGVTIDSKPLTPILNTNEKREVALQALTVVLAPEFIPLKAAVTGEFIGAGLNVAPKVYAAATGQEVTLKDYAKAGLEGAATGAVFSVVGGKALEVAGKFIGGPLGGVVGGATKLGAENVPLVTQLGGIGVKTAVNAGLGAGFNAGVEVVKTGQVTPKNILVGASYGAAFSAAGELAGMGGGVIRSRMDNSLPGQRIQQRLNEYYVYGSERNFKLDLTDKILIKTTGLRPQKPVPEPFVMKDVPTASENSYVTLRPAESKTVDSNVVVSRDMVTGEPSYDVVSNKSLNPISEVYGKSDVTALASKAKSSDVVDVIPFKDTVPVDGFKVEKADVLNMNADRTRVVRESELWDVTQVAYGRSVSPESIRLEAELARVRGNSVGGSNLEKYGLTSEELAGLKSDVDLQGGRGALSFNKRTEPVTGDILEPFNVAEGRKAQVLQVKEANANTPLTLKDLSAKIRTGEYEGVLNPANDNAELDKLLSDAYGKVEAKQYGYGKPNVYARENAISALEKNSIFAGGKSEVKLRSEVIAVEKPARTEGLSKQYLDNLVAERAVSSQVAQQASNPFSVYAGPSLYRKTARQETEEEVSYSYPNGGLASPERLVNTPSVRERQTGAPLFGVGFNNILNFGRENKSRFGSGVTPLLESRVSVLSTPKQSAITSQANLLSLNSGISETSGLDLSLDQTPILSPITKDILTPIESPITVPRIPNTYPTPSYPDFTFKATKTSGALFNPDFKLNAGGFGGSFGRRRGLGSKRKRYPILTAKEFLNL